MAFKKVIFIIVFTACSYLATAQTFFAGTSFSYAFGLPLSISRDAGLVNRYNVETPGKSDEHTYGFGFRFFSPDIFSSVFGISSDFGFVMSNGGFTAYPFTFQTVFDPQSGQNVQPLYSYDVVSNLSLLKINTEFHYIFLKQLSAGLGLWGQYLLNSGFYQTETLLNYDSIRFQNGQRTRAVNAGGNLSDDKFRFGPQVSINYLFPFNDRIHLQTSLGTSMDIGSITDGVGPGAYKFIAGVSLLFKTESHHGFKQEQEFPPLKTDDNTDSVVSLKKEFHRVELYSVINGEEVHRAEFRRISINNKRITVLLKKFSLKDHTFASFKKLLPEEAEEFHEEDLFKATHNEIQHNILNILGFRLRENPQYSLILEATPDFRTEAISVQEYLTTVWGIESTRIQMNVSLYSVHSFLKLSSQTNGLFDFLKNEWIEQNYEMTPLRLIHNFTKSDSIRNWFVKIKGNDRELALLQGLTLEELHASKVSVSFPAKTPPNALTLTLEAESSNGNIVRAYDTIILKELPEVVYSVREFFIPASESVDDAFLKTVQKETNTAYSMEILFPGGQSEIVTKNIAQLWSALGGNVLKSQPNISLKASDKEANGMLLRMRIP